MTRLEPFHRPELRDLTPADERRVRACLRSRRFRCACCGSRRFEVGAALYLGFLFEQAGLDDYMVAVTCTRRSCASPRNGVRITGTELFGSRPPR